jgi:hypothetical protein
MTMVDTLYDGHYRSREKLAFAFAEILNEEARAIEEAGVAVVQFDEPAFNVYFDEVRDWGMAALERAAAGLGCKTAVHICYGYGIKANIEWKKTLGGQWRQYEEPFRSSRARPSTRSARVRQHHVPLELMAPPGRQDVLVGGNSTWPTSRMETPGAGAPATIRAAMAYVPRIAVPLHQLRDGALPGKWSPGKASGHCGRCRDRAPWNFREVHPVRLMGESIRTARVFPKPGRSRMLPKVFCFKY